MLAVAAGLWIAVDANPKAVAAAFGAGGVVVLELLLARRRKRIRNVWRSTAVKGLALAAGVAFAVAVAIAVPDRGLSALIGGSVTYLLVLTGAEIRSTAK